MSELASLKGMSWWESNESLTKDGSAAAGKGASTAEAEEEEWQREVIGVLEGLSDITVEDGCVVLLSGSSRFAVANGYFAARRRTTRCIFRNYRSFWTGYRRFSRRLRSS